MSFNFPTTHYPQQNFISTPTPTPVSNSPLLGRVSSEIPAFGYPPTISPAKMDSSGYPPNWPPKSTAPLVAQQQQKKVTKEKSPQVVINQFIQPQAMMPQGNFLPTQPFVVTHFPEQPLAIQQREPLFIPHGREIVVPQRGQAFSVDYTRPRMEIISSRINNPVSSSLTVYNWASGNAMRVVALLVVALALAFIAAVPAPLFILI